MLASTAVTVALPLATVILLPRTLQQWAFFFSILVIVWVGVLWFMARHPRPRGV